MGFQIEDGKGRGNILGVNKNHKGLVHAEINETAHFVSLRDGLAFNWVSEDDDAAAGDMIFYLKNDDVDRDLFIDLMRICAELASTFKIWEVTGTAAGSNALTAKNMNLGSGVTGSYTARGDGAITGLSTSGSMIAAARLTADTCIDIRFDDVLIIPTNKAIAVEYDTGSNGDCEILVRGYFLNTSDET